MSCRHRLDSPSASDVIHAPSSVQKWQRWPNRLPRACNDNPRSAPAELRILLVAGLRELLASATTLMHPRAIRGGKA